MKNYRHYSSHSHALHAFKKIFPFIIFFTVGQNRGDTREGNNQGKKAPLYIPRLLRIPRVKQPYEDTEDSMVLMLDGNSEIDPNLWVEIGNLICVIHMFRLDF